MSTSQILAIAFIITFTLWCLYGLFKDWKKFREHRKYLKELDRKCAVAEEMQEVFCSIDKIVTHYLKEIDLSNKTEEEIAIIKDSMTIALLLNGRSCRHIFRTVDMFLYNMGLNTPPDRLKDFYKGMDVLKENVISAVQEKQEK